MEIDAPRKRIGLSMRLDDEPGQQAKAGPGRDQQRPRIPQPNRRDSNAGGGATGGALADALRAAMQSGKPGGKKNG